MNGTESNVSLALTDMVEQFYSSPNDLKQSKSTENLDHIKSEDVGETPNLTSLFFFIRLYGRIFKHVSNFPRI